MENYSIYMLKKVQYFQAVSSYQTDLYSQQNPNQNSSKLLSEYKKKFNSNVYVE